MIERAGNSKFENPPESRVSFFDFRFSTVHPISRSRCHSERSEESLQLLRLELRRFFATKLIVPKAPWSAVAPATALSFGIHGGNSAAALQGASHIFMQRGELQAHEMFAENDSAGVTRHSSLVTALLA
jgi:predicted transcriptional regulator